MEFTSEQQHFIDDAVKGKNVFLTGVAGTGKSACLSEAIKKLRAKKKFVAVTASTGVAAANIGGITFYSLFKSGLMAASPIVMVNKMHISTIKKLRALSTIVIDEISMLSPIVFEKGSEILKMIKRNDKPFGGTQIICIGDFHQLPYVLKEGKRTMIFEKELWIDCMFQTHTLSKIHRQENKEFIEILRQVRLGDITDETVERINATQNNDLEKRFGMKPTIVYSYNRDVDRENNFELSKLNGETHVFKDRYENDVDLRVGAQVMLTHNIDVEGGLFNGARGVVESIDGKVVGLRMVDDRQVLVTNLKIDVEDGTGKKIKEIEFMPLRLAWSITIHKTQGMTIDLLEANVSGVFEMGQMYTILSRGVSLDRMRIIGFHPNKNFVDPNVVEFYKKRRISSE